MKESNGHLNGEALKEAGMALVLSNNKLWKAAAEVRFEEYISMTPPMRFIVAEFRIYAFEKGLGDPHHPNAWGGLTSSAAKRGIIVPTGVFRKSPLAPAHVRECKEWIRKP